MENSKQISNKIASELFACRRIWRKSVDAKSTEDLSILQKEQIYASSAPTCCRNDLMNEQY